MFLMIPQHSIAEVSFQLKNVLLHKLLYRFNELSQKQK